MPEFLIIHVSDLHFGREFYGARSTAISPLAGAANSVRAFPAGFRTHDVQGCVALANAIERIIVKRRPKLALVTVTGDLSVEGSDSEFSLAHTFLRGAVPLTKSTSTGLAGIVRNVLCVPGNHDHWNGTLFSFAGQLGPAFGIHGSWFDGPAWHCRFHGRDLQLQVIGLDSCAGSGWRFGARGVLDPQALHAVGTEIAKADAEAHARSLHPLRIVLMHHPPNIIGATHALDPASVRDFDRFCRTHKIKFVLTGHTHVAEAQTPTQACPVHEFRCGTTLQSAPPGKAPRKGWTFLVHSVTKGASRFEWSTEEFQRLPAGVGAGAGFRRVGDWGVLSA